eukprot:3789773-Heterocapsa_arctica.AAC.2
MTSGPSEANPTAVAPAAPPSGEPAVSEAVKGLAPAAARVDDLDHAAALPSLPLWAGATPHKRRRPWHAAR